MPGKGEGSAGSRGRAERGWQPGWDSQGFGIKGLKSRWERLGGSAKANPALPVGVSAAARALKCFSGRWVLPFGEKRNYRALVGLAPGW